jgi:transposase
VTPLVLSVETSLGYGYEVATASAIGRAAPTGPSVSCVRLKTFFGNGRQAGAWLHLTPDEARSLGADLTRWAGHAEAEGRKP